AGVLAIVLLLMVAATGVVVGLGRVLRPTASATGTRAGNAPMAAGPSAAAPGSGGGSATLDSNSIAARVDRFVVDINTLLGFQSGRAAGTGIVISGSGLVLTNNHVVAGSTSISVTEVSNGRTFTGTVVGYNRTEDVAVVQMRNASGLPTASIGDSSRVRVGDAVLGIGNAGGAGGTPAVAPGTVSALNQSITATDEGTGSSEQLTGLIQVDANIQAGDSGGPLVNNTGQVIGIDTAASVGFRYQASGGTGFAIPINQALDIAHQIIAGQASSKIHIGATGFLGVQVGTGDNGGGPGAPVVGVVSGSPAAAAGLGAGAVINSVNGQAVTSANQLTELLDNRHPGDRVRVGWTDQGGQDHNSSIRLIKGPVG
ncbi:MAG TPA: trypsin-like peptidase domain-containing protein, partial [Rugosimonospora sp.]|nr:trypsin-like peptidase domain-containing protein [Rugosimonospora sp.]